MILGLGGGYLEDDSNGVPELVDEVLAYVAVLVRDQHLYMYVCICT